MTRKKTRLVDIAKTAGVSTATVSRALSGDGYVKPELAASIHEIARRLNYKSPQALTGQRVLLVTSEEAMLDSARSQFSLYVLEGLRRRAKILDAELDVLVTDSDPENALKDQANQGNIAGALLLSVDDCLLPVARDMSCPVVVVNGDDPLMQLDSVTPCNRSASALATQHLVSLGHKDIAFLVNSGRRTIERRIEGWRDIIGSGVLIPVDDWTVEAAEAAFEPYRNQPLPFTGLVAAGDVLAIGAVKAFRSMGLCVPDDISVIGIDGLPMGGLLSPPLTTVEIPMENVGTLAIDMLCELIRDRGANQTRPVRRIELACKLNVRGTTARLFSL